MKNHQSEIKRGGGICYVRSDVLKEGALGALSEHDWLLFVLEAGDGASQNTNGTLIWREARMLRHARNFHLHVHESFLGHPDPNYYDQD
jgi:hypothetical protein